MGNTNKDAVNARLNEYIEQYDKLIESGNNSSAENILDRICKEFPQKGIRYLLEADFIYHNKDTDNQAFNNLMYGKDNGAKKYKVTYANDIGLFNQVVRKQNHYVDLLNSADALFSAEEKELYADRIKKLENLVKNFAVYCDSVKEYKKSDKKKENIRNVVIAAITLPIAVALIIYLIKTLFF